KPAKEGYMWWATEGCHNINRYSFGEGSPAAKDEGAPEGAFVNEYPLSKYHELAERLPLSTSSFANSTVSETPPLSLRASCSRPA
ncbi:hypothetical protein DACRYDRAFT_25472, partial [Dacryopinax primogenitus]